VDPSPFFASIHLTLPEALPSELDVDQASPPDGSAPEDSGCGTGTMEVDGEPHEVDGGSGMPTFPFSCKYSFNFAQDLQGPSHPPPPPPSILDMHATPTAALPKLGKEYASLQSALNAAYSTGPPEGSAEGSSEEGVDGGREELGASLLGLDSYGESDDDGVTADPMDVDSGFRVPNIALHRPASAHPSPPSEDSASSLEEDSTPWKGRTLPRNRTSCSIRPYNMKLEDSKGQRNLKRLKRRAQTALKRKREDMREDMRDQKHLHVIDLTDDLEDEVGLPTSI
jgi:hypothetical protein